MRERPSRGRLRLRDGEAPEKKALGIGTGALTCTAQTPHRGDNHSKVEGWRSVHVQNILRSETEKCSFAWVEKTQPR